MLKFAELARDALSGLRPALAMLDSAAPGALQRVKVAAQLAAKVSDPVAKMAAGQFIRRRATEESPRSLRSLSGNRGYRSDEVAFKGDFFDPYVGKVYRDGVTEVFAMGVDSFSNPETLARRAQQDPQTLEFVAGFVQSPIDPMAATHAALRGILLEMEEQATDVVGATLQATLAALAATVELTPDTDSGWMAGYYFGRDTAQIGRFEDSGFYVLKGKVRNPKTSRMGSGFTLVSDAQRTGRIQIVAQVAGSDAMVLQAMYALYKKNGVMPSYYRMDNLDYLKENGA